MKATERERERDREGPREGEGLREGRVRRDILGGREVGTEKDETKKIGDKNYFGD